jgi:hypothetical protein
MSELYNLILELIEYNNQDDLNIILFGAKELLNITKNFDKIDNKAAWDKRNNKEDNAYVVFTTDYKDILGMSSRSTWTSCQDLRPEKEKKVPRLYQNVVGSAFEPQVGMIYLTDGKDTKYGENIIARSMVWIVVNKTNKEEVLSLQRIYPSYNNTIANIFKEALEKNIGMKIISFDEGIDPENYITNFSAEYLLPYDDVGIKNVKIIDDRFEKFTLSFAKIIKNHLMNIKPLAIPDITRVSKIKAKKQIKENDFTLSIGYPPSSEQELQIFAENLINENTVKRFYDFFVNIITKDIIDQDLYFEEYLINSYETYIKNNKEFNDDMIDNFIFFIANNDKFKNNFPDAENMFLAPIFENGRWRNTVFKGSLDIPKIITSTFFDYI